MPKPPRKSLREYAACDNCGEVRHQSWFTAHGDGINPCCNRSNRIKGLPIKRNKDGTRSFRLGFVNSLKYLFRKI